LAQALLLKACPTGTVAELTILSNPGGIAEVMMLQWLWIISSIFGALARPPANDTVDTARWILSQTSWGVLTTSSINLGGAAFGNPISLVEVGGTPYFYVSMLDVSIQDLQMHPQCTLSLSEASVDCAKLNLDPEDPRCTRLSLSGNMVNVTNESEHQKAKSLLFEQHPAMKSWPTDHSWIIRKIQIENIWLVAKYGGAADVPVKDYFDATAPVRGQPAVPTHKPLHPQPLFTEKAKTARWLVRESTWATLATTSVHLHGMAFGNPISVADGPDDNATGVPYMLISKLDTSAEDLRKNDTCTLTFSQAEVNCASHGITGSWDPEDPRCTRLALTGRMVGVRDGTEKVFAEKALIAKHPVMKEWLGLGDFHVVKMDIETIFIIDMFGGANYLTPLEYFNADMAKETSKTDSAATASMMI
jgi:hypothetical protein